MIRHCVGVVVSYKKNLIRPDQSHMNFLDWGYYFSLLVHTYDNSKFQVSTKLRSTSLLQQSFIQLQVQLTTASSKISCPPVEWFRQTSRKLPNLIIQILYPIYGRLSSFNAVTPDPVLLVHYHHYGGKGNEYWSQHYVGCDHEHYDHLQFSCLVDGRPSEDSSCHHSWDSNDSHDTMIGGMPSEALTRKREAHLMLLIGGVSANFKAWIAIGLQASILVAPKAI